MRVLLCVTTWLLLAIGLAVPAAAQAPAITVTAPGNGIVIQGANVTVDFSVSGFSLIKSLVPLTEAGKRPEANRAGEGHIHFMLDAWPVVVWDRGEAYTFTDVPPGEHQLMVELVNNDHSPLSPPVVQHIRFRTAMVMPVVGTAPQTQRAPLLMVLAFGLICTALVLRRSMSSAR